MKKSIFLLFALLALTACAQTSSFEKLRKSFIKGYEKLQVSDIQINYTDVLNSIQSKDKILLQEAFFKDMSEKLQNIDVSSLATYEKLDFYIMQYETRLNLIRLELEKKWNPNEKLNSSKSIYTVKNGKEWYAYLLKRWVDIDVEPNNMFQFGLKEIEKVKNEMKMIQLKSGLSKEAFSKFLNDSSFYFHKVKDVKKAFLKIKSNVVNTSDELFPYTNEIPDVSIARGTNPALAHAPAYYGNRTFYFNFFDKPFNKRQLGWFYAHEAIPGHHYQAMVNDIVKRTDIQNLFWYAGFVEGWGAYVEYLGNELGVYNTIYDEYGKWEWDLIRSVRVSLDVAINYYGWSNKKALEFWKKHIKNQDDIGIREIKRMKRWPAQVITYKYGANLFLKHLNEAKKKNTFNYKSFHKKVLKNGDIPLSVFLKIN